MRCVEQKTAFFVCLVGKPPWAQQDSSLNFSLTLNYYTGYWLSIKSDIRSECIHFTDKHKTRSEEINNISVQLHLKAMT
jgi:hypothetical protein